MNSGELFQWGIDPFDRENQGLDFGVNDWFENKTDTKDGKIQLSVAEPVEKLDSIHSMEGDQKTDIEVKRLDDFQPHSDAAERNFSAMNAMETDTQSLDERDTDNKLSQLSVVEPVEKLVSIHSMEGDQKTDIEVKRRDNPQMQSDAT